MNCNPNNPCAGAYGKCLDVKITNVCNGSCKFCIEKDGLQTENVPVEKLIESTNTLSDYKKVLILGGEPFLYPHLAEYINGLVGKDEIFITTNGSVLPISLLHTIAGKLKAVNISIHHFNEDMNSEIIGTKISFKNIKNAISILKGYNVKVRINSNLIKGGIDSTAKVQIMSLFAIGLGADEIRFAELQNCPDLYVDAAKCFEDVHKNPYCDGCEQIMAEVDGFKVILRSTCGIVNPVKEIPKEIEPNKSETKVMYTNSKIHDGWSSGDNCHSPRRSMGCH